MNLSLSIHFTKLNSKVKKCNNNAIGRIQRTDRGRLVGRAAALTLNIFDTKTMRGAGSSALHARKSAPPQSNHQTQQRPFTSSAVSWKFAMQPKVSLFTFDARFFCSSTAQNAPPACVRLAGGAFCAADKQKNRTSKVNKHIKI